MNYVVSEGIPRDDALLDSIIQLDARIFDQGSADWIMQLANRPAVLVVTALVETDVIGYKVGYEHSQTQYPSWLGGVHPNYRNRGIASEMMRLQHDWCKLHGYRTVRTHTRNQWRDMLILNLRHGFDVIGTITEGGAPKIIMEKRFI